MIAPRLGQNAADVFVAANVTVYSGGGGIFAGKHTIIQRRGTETFGRFPSGAAWDRKSMKIAVLSGKGGTGKTFVAVNLACSARETHYIDCDVEEPNGHLFLKPRDIREEGVCVMTPVFDEKKCTGCRVCVDFCRYNALALVQGKVLHFKEVCHSCGGCVLLCPEEAVEYATRNIGMIREGRSGDVNVMTGILDTGEVSGVPVVRALCERLPSAGVSVIDCPPGSACLVMESIKDADYCVMVSEPTAFGAHDLKNGH